jgi:hypothetical protein
MERVGRLVVVAVLALALARESTFAQVIKQVPSDAMVVLKVSNLETTSGKIGVLAKQFGIDQILIPLADPLAWAQDQMKMAKGINKRGEFAAVYLNPAAAGGDQQKSALMLIPVSDYAAFLTNFQNPKTEGEISEVTMPDSAEPGFVAKWGDYAALSPSKDIVSKKPVTPLAVAGLTSDEFSKKDAVVYANFKELRTIALPALKANRQTWITQIQRAIDQQRRLAGARRPASTRPAAGAQANAANEMAPLIKAVANRAFDLAEAFMNTTEAATYGIDFDKAGLKTTLVAQYVPGSYMSNVSAKMKNSSSSLLTGLPSARYLMFMGVTADPALSSQVVSDAVDPLLPQLNAAGEKAKPFVTYINAFKKIAAVQTDARQGWIAPTGQLGMTSLFQMVQIMTGDSHAIEQANKDLIQSSAAFSKLSSGPGMDVKTTFTPEAKTVEGVSFTHTQMQFNVTGKTAQDRQAVQALKMMYGPNGLSGYNAAIDDKHFVAVLSDDEKLLSGTVVAVKANSDNLSSLAPVKAVAANLPSARFAELYIPVDVLVATGVSYAKQFGMPVNLPLPPNLPPIGVTASTAENATRIDGFIPSQLVQSMIAAGMQMFMAVQGGGQPGGPGGL